MPDQNWKYIPYFSQRISFYTLIRRILIVSILHKIIYLFNKELLLTVFSTLAHKCKILLLWKVIIDLVGQRWEDRDAEDIVAFLPDQIWVFWVETG
jgi:hypothetical protein